MPPEHSWQCRARHATCACRAVAQTGSLLCRRLATCVPSAPAGCQPATQQVANLRYVGATRSVTGIASGIGMKTIFLFCCLAACAVRTAALTTDNFVSEQGEAGSFCVVANGGAADIFTDANDWPGVRRAAMDLQADIKRVSGLTPKFFTDKEISGANVILIGTIGRSEIIDRLVRDGKIDVSEISNKWESFLVQTVPQPFPGLRTRW